MRFKVGPDILMQIDSLFSRRRFFRAEGEISGTDTRARG